MKASSIIRFAITAVVVIAAGIGAWLLWEHYMYAPWTRDARVRADVVNVTPDVSGLITRVAVSDNDRVQRGDLLFVIDPFRFRNAVQQAKAELDAARTAVKVATANINISHANMLAAQATYAMRHEIARRRKKLGVATSKAKLDNAINKAKAAHAKVHQAQAALAKAKAAKTRAGANVDKAKAAVAAARLDLRRSKVRAPVDGTVTNLNLSIGEYAHSGQAAIALITDDMWVTGYFEETKLSGVQVGDKVDIRLLDGTRFKGHVTGIAKGIADTADKFNSGLLSNIEKTSNWVRLAERIPVRISIDHDTVPDGTKLIAGLSATVTVHTGDKPGANPDASR